MSDDLAARLEAHAERLRPLNRYPFIVTDLLFAASRLRTPTEGARGDLHAIANDLRFNRVGSWTRDEWQAAADTIERAATEGARSAAIDREDLEFLFDVTRDLPRPAIDRVDEILMRFGLAPTQPEGER